MFQLISLVPWHFLEVFLCVLFAVHCKYIVRLCPGNSTCLPEINDVFSNQSDEEVDLLFFRDFFFWLDVCGSLGGAHPHCTAFFVCILLVTVFVEASFSALSCESCWECWWLHSSIMSCQAPLCWHQNCGDQSQIDFPRSKLYGVSCGASIKVRVDFCPLGCLLSRRTCLCVLNR